MNRSGKKLGTTSRHKYDSGGWKDKWGEGNRLLEERRFRYQSGMGQWVGTRPLCEKKAVELLAEHEVREGPRRLVNAQKEWENNSYGQGRSN